MPSMEFHIGSTPRDIVSQAQVHQGINWVRGVPQNRALPPNTTGAKRINGDRNSKKYIYQGRRWDIPTKILTDLPLVVDFRFDNVANPEYTNKDQAVHLVFNSHNNIGLRLAFPVFPQYQTGILILPD